MHKDSVNVSVIITTYNRPDFLRRALHSILGQTKIPKEIFIFNDSPIKLKEEFTISFKNALNISIVNRSKPLGANYNRNEGLRQAKYDIVMFLDDDDAWLGNKVEHQLSLLSLNNPIVFSGKRAVSSNNLYKTIALIRPSKNKKCFTFEDLLKVNEVGTISSVALYRPAFKKGVFLDTSLDGMQDFEWYMQLSLHYPILWDGCYNIYYTIHDNLEQTSRKTSKYKRSAKHIIQKYEKILNAKQRLQLRRSLYANIARAARSVNRLESIYYSLKSKDFKAIFLSLLPTYFINIAKRQLNSVHHLKTGDVTLVAMRSPFPPYGGEKIAIYNFIDSLIKLGKQIDLIIIDDGKVNNTSYSPLFFKINSVAYFKISTFRAMLNTIYSIFKIGCSIQELYFYHPKAQKLLNIIDDEKKIRFLHTFRLGLYKSKNKNILYAADAISKKYLNIPKNISLLKKIIYFYEKTRVYAREKRIVHQYNQVIFHSASDAEFLEKKDAFLYPVIKERVINSFLPIKESTRKRLLYIANFKSEPNMIGLQYLLDIWDSETLNLQLAIIGPNLPMYEKYEIAKRKEVVYLGVLEDLESEILDSYGVLCPIEFGAGMQNKIIDGMSVGRPVITSNFSAEPYKYYLPDVRLQIYNNENEFETEVKKLCKIPYANNIGESLFNSFLKLIKEYNYSKLLGKDLSE